MKTVLNQWLWLALISSLLMLGIAHAFETFGRMAPCELCLKEREVYWLAAAIAAAGLAIRFTQMKIGRWVNALLALIFLGGMVLASYHAGAEWKLWAGPASCTAGHVEVSGADMARLLNGGPIAAPACDKAAWIFLGISMAGWNALISLKLAVLSALAAWRAAAGGRNR